MNKNIIRGARIVTKKWLQVARSEKLYIVSNEEYFQEIKLIEEYAKKSGAYVEIMLFPKQEGQVGCYFDLHEDAFDSFDVILGATTHSLVTTKAVKRAIERGSRYLSLPLSTNNNKSLLEYNFLLTDMKECSLMANWLQERLLGGKELVVTTATGTHLTCSMEGRKAQFFTADTKHGNGYASSSFEIFIPIVEDFTYGTGIVDASLGYLGIPKEPVCIHLEQGRIRNIEQNETGITLSRYIADFEDEDMYVAGEFGIGLNKMACCRGNSYIEDESAFGTFHIGFGRNIAFGGKQEAKAHFDLVFHKPNIYIDGYCIIKQGELNRCEDIKVV